MNNSEKLRIFMINNNLSVEDIADLIKINTRTVYSWLRSKDNVSSKRISNENLDLIESKLKNSNK